MSASSQAATDPNPPGNGQNQLTRAITVTTSGSFGAWFKFNTFPKLATGFDVPFSVENPAGGAAYRGLGLQLGDASGTYGTPNSLQGYFFSGTGGFDFVTMTDNDILNKWMFGLFSFSGTTASLFWTPPQSVPGPVALLHSKTFALDFNATALTRVSIGTDFFGAYSHCSFWAARLWLGAALTYAESFGEASSPDGAPRSQLGSLVSDLRMVDGPTAATSTQAGGDFTLTGTMATDTSRPKFVRGAMAFGFPF